MAAATVERAIEREEDDILDRAPCRIGRISLVVRDMQGTGRFYRETIGLSVIAEDAHGLHLGAGEDVLVTLRHEPEALSPAPGEAGLYHTAFLLPSRVDLAGWLHHAAKQRSEISGASDHVVSEAVYLADPEGNGVEIYADRPSATWPRIADEIHVLGMERLDLRALMQEAKHPWSGMPSGSRVGHVHLQVGDIPSADIFYGSLLGFRPNNALPSAHFYSTGGYHHQLAANVWQSPKAGLRVPGRRGLAEVQVLVRDVSMIADIHRRLAAAGRKVHAEVGGDLLVSDPWNTTFRLTHAQH